MTVRIRGVATLTEDLREFLPGLGKKEEISMKKGVFFVLILLLVNLQFSYAAGSGSVEATLDKLIGLFRSYNRAPKGEKLNERELEENRKITGEVRKIFDYEALINTALVDQKGNISAGDRTKIFKMFKDLIELMALPQGSYFYNNSKSTFLPPKTEGDRITIPSTNYNMDKDIEVNMDYVFSKKGGNWMMVDIILNGHSLVQSYRRQINRVVKKKGVKGLVDTLEKKYNEAMGRM